MVVVCTTRPDACDLPHTLGRVPRLLSSGNGAAGGGVAEACGAVFGQAGTGPLGWYACPRLTLFATEWSAARRKPIRAAMLHFSATISADVKARRLPTSGRRKFPSGNFRSARDFEGAKRVSRGQAYRQPKTSPFARRPPPHAPPPPQRPAGPSPFARNRGMSPLPPCVVQARQHHHDQHRRDVESRAGCEVHVLDVNA